MNEKQRQEQELDRLDRRGEAGRAIVAVAGYWLAMLIKLFLYLVALGVIVQVLSGSGL